MHEAPESSLIGRCRNSLSQRASVEYSWPCLLLSKQSKYKVIQYYQTITKAVNKLTWQQGEVPMNVQISASTSNGQVGLHHFHSEGLHPIS